jgi:hypothetical protein
MSDYRTKAAQIRSDLLLMLAGELRELHADQDWAGVLALAEHLEEESAKDEQADA